MISTVCQVAGPATHCECGKATKVFFGSIAVLAALALQGCGALDCVGSPYCAGPRMAVSETGTRAMAQVRIEEKSLPTSFDIDSLVTEGAVLRNDLLMELLTVRGLPFVEVKIRRFQAKGFESIGGLAMSDMEGEWGLRVGVGGIVKPYARIELAKSGDPRCIPEQELPPRIRRYGVNLPPVLPDTCIAVSFIDKPTARYALSFDPKHPFGPGFGYWSLVDTTTNEILASVTTWDTAEAPQNGNSGHSFLSWRIRRKPGSFQMHPQVVIPYAVKIADVPQTTYEGRAIKPARVKKVLVTESEYRDEIFYQGNLASVKHWGSAVKEAKLTRWGYDGPRLLDWSQRTLTDLKVGYPNESRAVEGGFLVIYGWWDYRTKTADLQRYDSSGKLVWAVKVQPPELADGDSCGRGLSSVGATRDYVVFYGRCGPKFSYEEHKKTGKDFEVMMLEIRRSDLPKF